MWWLGRKNGTLRFIYLNNTRRIGAAYAEPKSARARMGWDLTGRTST